MSAAYWTDSRVRDALGPEAANGGMRKSVGGSATEYVEISTDTRTIQAGSLFVALIGDRFDGHAYLREAADRGAAGAVVSRVPEDWPEGLVCYRVADTLRALGDLAHHFRRGLDARVCAVAGSNGKTTTKNMVAAVLGTRFRVHATTGNLNNLIGVPLTLLSAPRDAEALVVEVGTNSPGEVARLAEIVEPDAAMVTSIAEEHLEGLGDLQGVLREETAILAVLPRDGLALVAEEPAMLPARARELAPRVLVAGWGDHADAAVRAEEVSLDDDGRARFRWKDREVRLRLRGRINVRNALLALGLGDAWGVDPDAAVAALGTMEAARMRGEVHHFGSLMVISDCYNANPASMEAAIDLLASLPRRGGRVAVLGTMREMGAASDDLHRRVAEHTLLAKLDLVVATGEFGPAFEPLAERLGDRLIRAEDPADVYDALAARLGGDEVVLLKGSRGVALERLLPRLERDFADPGGEVATPASGE